MTIPSLRSGPHKQRAVQNAGAFCDSQFSLAELLTPSGPRKRGLRRCAACRHTSITRRLTSREGEPFFGWLTMAHSKRAKNGARSAKRAEALLVMSDAPRAAAAHPCARGISSIHERHGAAGAKEDLSAAPGTARINHLTTSIRHPSNFSKTSIEVPFDRNSRATWSICISTLPNGG